MHPPPLLPPTNFSQIKRFYRGKNRKGPRGTTDMVWPRSGRNRGKEGEGTRRREGEDEGGGGGQRQSEG